MIINSNYNFLYLLILDENINIFSSLVFAFTLDTSETLSSLLKKNKKTAKQKYLTNERRGTLFCTREQKKILNPIKGYFNSLSGPNTDFTNCCLKIPLVKVKDRAVLGPVLITSGHTD